jgi:hypothetical protein
MVGSWAMDVFGSGQGTVATSLFKFLKGREFVDYFSEYSYFQEGFCSLQLLP